MNKEMTKKYQPYKPIHLPDRTWPESTITKAPIWCSVDLRDGNQALIQPMNLEEKLEMFQLLVDIGFKEIEVGFPSAARVEYDFCRMLIERNLIPDDVSIQVLTQARDHLIKKSFAALQGAKQAVVHLYNSTSVLQRRVVFGMSKQEIIDLGVAGARLIKEEAAQTDTRIKYEYSPESFTGTELDYAIQICEAVTEVWEPTPENRVIINLPATVEMATPNIYADQIEYFIRNMKYRDRTIISLHAHNDRGTAVAATELALMAGADRVEGTLFGNGERTGNVDIITLALNMFTQGVNPKLDLGDINRIIAISEKTTKLQVPKRYPYAGELVYTAFSGSHQDAINKGMAAYATSNNGLWEVPYLAIDPDDVGRTYESIIRINSQSGKGGVAFIMDREFGFKLPKKMHPEFGAIIQKVSDTMGDELSLDIIYHTFEKEYILTNSCYNLHSFNVVKRHLNSKKEISTADIEVVIEIHNQEQTLRASGNGPLDAFCNALRESVGLEFSLQSYHEHALTQGSGSQAVSYIKIKDKRQKEFWGAGVDTDIMIASIKALLSALNRACIDCRQQDAKNKW